ncbi:hypothetical protein IU487_33755 [Nocardia puris]|uniref:hypothetical protein n=1 Tax=Nocardia puris TaxID=208602 RepID=UPI001894E3E8|nr:hypothetical protein [Nocardia puris]MBF6215967.1 hypothetical protein [Nocardia puris]
MPYSGAWRGGPAAARKHRRRHDVSDGIDFDSDAFDPRNDPQRRAEHARRTVDAQGSPEFQAWLHDADDELRAVMRDVPEIAALDDPWTAEGLQLLEAHLRKRFATLAGLRQSPSAPSFERFLGEVYRRRLEGAWVNLPGFARDGATIWPVVGLSYRPDHLDPYELIANAMVAESRRNPLPPKGRLARVFDRFATDYRDWVDAGRPSRDEWTRHRMDRLGR